MNPTKSEALASERVDLYKLAVAGFIALSAMAAFYILKNIWLVVRILGLLAAIGVAAVIASRTALGAETLEFAQGSRAELRKVVWPTRSETTQTTLIVIAMVVIMGLLLWLLDVVLLWSVRLIAG